ncbi:hypothetical protein [Aliiglaciecola sp. LCG003]|uniref:hypothetical protein n=1 Tax=Aliiglaciecola sp. LCG003 TaxID=3053655 RepID=UPI002572FD95|nr:hypothetical protein [Aliiglaciecola sp. LCG003]WJG11207.1 hypothetical protein QR722_09320 [Aliiglaciecola sp. LCG003]
MINKLSFLLTFILITTTLNVQGAMITNGDFSSCDYSGWNKDTDGFGDVSMSNDFVIEGIAPNCQAVINADYLDTEVFFANTLFQSLDLTAMASSQLILSFDIMVTSQMNSQDQGFIADYLVIGLNDGLGNLYDENGQLGTLFDADVDGENTYQLTYNLAASLLNQSGWYLDFQLNIGADNNGFTDFAGSSLYIDNVTLQEVKVSAPQSLSLFCLSLCGLLLSRKKRISLKSAEQLATRRKV